MAGQSRSQTVGKSTYYTHDGKTWVLQGKSVEDAEHCWRMKINKANQQLFFINAADPARKSWELPDVVAEEEEAQQQQQQRQQDDHPSTQGTSPSPETAPPSAAGGAVAPPPPRLHLSCPVKPEAEGFYELSHDLHSGRPLWQDATGNVVYASPTGHWLVGTRESLASSAGWVMACEASTTTLPHGVAQWAHFASGRWIPDPSIRVVAGGGSGLDADDSPETLQSGRTEYYLENGYWVAPGKTLEDKAFTWKMRDERDGSRSFVNPWTRVRVEELPDIVGEEAAAAAAEAAPASDPPPAPPAAPAGAGGGGGGMMAEVAHHTALLGLIDEKERAYRQREAVLASGAAAGVPPEAAAAAAQPRSAVEQLASLDTQIQEERAKLLRHAGTEVGAVGAALQRESAGERDAGITSLARMQQSLQEQERELKTRAQSLESAARQQAEAVAARIGRGMQEEMAQHAAQQSAKAGILTSYASKLDQQQKDFDSQAAAAMQDHQRYLTQRALELEQEHDAETKKLQDAARHLERLAREKEAKAEALQAITEEQVQIQERGRRLAESAEAGHPTSESLAEHELLLEKRRLQDEVNDFYMQTSAALAAARRGLEEKAMRPGEATDSFVTPHSHIDATRTSSPDESMYSMPTADTRDDRSHHNHNRSQVQQHPQQQQQQQHLQAASWHHHQPLHRTHSVNTPSVRTAISRSGSSELQRGSAAVAPHSASVVPQGIPAVQAVQAVPHAAWEEVAHLRHALEEERRRYETLAAEQAASVSQRELVQSEMQEFMQAKEKALQALEQQKEDLQQGYQEREAAREERLAAMQEDLQARMAQQVQSVKDDLMHSFKETNTAASSAAVEELQRVVSLKDEAIEGMERRVADLRVEHEAEKAAILKLANSDVVTVRQQMERLKEQLVAASAHSESSTRHLAEIERLHAKNDELRKEILKLRMALSEQHDLHNKHLDESNGAARREGARLREELRNVKETVKRDHRREVEDLKETHRIEREALLADHKRDKEASQELHLEKKHAHAEVVAALRGEMGAMKERHAQELQAVKEQTQQEVADLQQEVEEGRKQNRVLQDNYDAYKRANKAMKAAQSIERSRSAQSEASMASAADAAAQAKHHLSVVLEDELKKLQTDFVEPSADVQSRLKRFRERSASRSHSSDVQTTLYSDPPPPSYYPRSLSPSPSPFGQSTQSPMSHASRPDDIKRLKYLKEQMKMRLSAEQASPA